MLREILLRPKHNVFLQVQERPRTKIFGYNFKKINYGCRNFVSFLFDARLIGGKFNRIYHCPGLSSRAVSFLRILMGWIENGYLDFGHWQAATNRTSEEQLQKMFCRLKQSHVLKNLIIPLIKSKYSNSTNVKKFKEQLKILNFCV
jgi:hypothetical protein